MLIIINIFSALSTYLHMLFGFINFSFNFCTTNYHFRYQVPYYWIGIKLYDLVAGKENLKTSYFLSKKNALELFPMLKKVNESETNSQNLKFFD